MRRRLAACFLLAFSTQCLAEPIRVATFNASLNRSGPGVLLKDILEGKSRQIEAVTSIIAAVDPDILLINEFDHDLDGMAARQFQEHLAAINLDYPHIFAAPSNTGIQTGFDLNRDGKTRGPEDAHGYGRFPGQYGMLLLSRFPLEETRTFSTFLWTSLPGAQLPEMPDGTPYYSAEMLDVLRLSSKGHWDIAVTTEQGPLHIFASHPTPPVFDGPEDRNGLRNADEIRFWTAYLDGTPLQDDAGSDRARDSAPFVILGDLNADPLDGDGVKSAINGLLTHPLVQDPQPASAGGAEASRLQKGRNSDHKGDPALDTADWNDKRGPGNLRVDYALPSRDLRVVDSGVFWPTKDDPQHRFIGSGKPASSDHRLVWVDIELP
jgi:hypothetical protein